MTGIKNYTGAITPVIFVIIYYILYHYLGFYNSKFIADWFALIGLGFMAAATFPVAMKALVSGGRNSTDRFILSYWLIWSMSLGHRAWITLLAMVRDQYPLNYQDWLTGPTSGIFAVGFALAAAYGAVAPFSGDFPLQRREVIIFSVAAGFSGIIAGIAIGVFFRVGWAN